MSTENNNPESRRPLKVRGASFATSFTSWLCRRKVTPNQISLLSVVFAGLCAACLFLLSIHSGWLAIMLVVLAAVFIQCRLLCNLFDGMVAVEGKKGTASGELFNDIPDRVADPLILVAAGYAISGVPWAIEVGWIAALLSVMTAYVRTLASSIAAPTSFIGPMAKQHRMATLTLACCLLAVEMCLYESQYILFVALVLIVVGCVVTIARRVVAAYRFMENKN